MKLAVFSDVHANLPALEAVLEDVAVRKPDMLFCLGDLVGYAPWPNEVVERMRDLRIPTIAGNYDEGVGLNSDDCGCAYVTDEDRARGHQSIAFTNSVVTDEARSYLRGLPRHLRITNSPPRTREATPFEILMVHGSPRRINEYLFEDRPDASFLRMMDAASCDVLLFGHTHRPFYRSIRIESDGAPRFKHVVNTGSVGKPKDGDPRACYALLDVATDAAPESRANLTVELVRVEYDVEKAARAIEASELPDAFAEMLRNGV